VNFNVNFNILLSKYIVRLMVGIKSTLIISRCTVQLWGGLGLWFVFLLDCLAYQVSFSAFAQSDCIMRMLYLSLRSQF
jgi:hypothetical protein